MTNRPTATTPLICSDDRHAAKVADLEQQLATLRQVARGYCPACGRGDAAPTVTDWEQQKTRADQAEAALTRVRAALHIADDEGLVVDRYRTDRGGIAWCFRCWGTDTCDGWLSLDHFSQQSAERARDRHVAEAHPPTPVACPACRRADQAGLAPAELHDDCAKEQQ
ncbi:hypothetical protein ABT119_06190 [Streptomyces sp. NPDC001910]|uniref:hypothetical protein n=1 Tax=Streptomyces sp. NPDC001910 TaxID=3154403 RepID=UPI00331927A0